jgi:membrane associated rhomboid family serine protease
MFFGQFSNFSVGAIAWEWGTIITSMFTHGGVFHLLGNMLFLYLYGDNVEEAMGKIWYLLFYLSCGLLAALAQALVNPNSGVPMVGASGAISGVIASYLLLYPRANVRVFYWFIILIGTIYIPAYLVLGWWLVQQVLAFPESMKAAGGVAVTAHLGGFVAGFVLTPFIKKKGIKLFQSGHSRAFARNR